MSMRGSLLSPILVPLLVPNAAFASPANEQTRGRELIAQLQSGAKSCSRLSREDFDHIGEYVMERALRSTRLHQAMNDRMRLMLGEQAERRMHGLMGSRFAGCDSAYPVTNGVMGPGTMGGHDNRSSPSVMRTMMDSRGWSWMMGGGWRTMSREDWQRLERRWRGTDAARAHHGMGAGAIVAITLAGVLLLGVLVLVAITWRPVRRPPAAAAS